MEKNDKTSFIIGVYMGIIFTLIFVIILAWSCPTAILSTGICLDKLSKGEYTIDTIKTVRGDDVTVKYEFVKAKKHEDKN